MSQHHVVSGSARLHRLSLLFLKPQCWAERRQRQGGGRENTRGEPELSTLTEKEGRSESEKWGSAIVVWTTTARVHPSTLTCSTQTPEPSSGAQMIMVLSMEAESKLRGCCSSPPAGGERANLKKKQFSVSFTKYAETIGGSV